MRSLTRCRAARPPTRRSSTKAANAWLRSLGLPRRIDEGWTVRTTSGATPLETAVPRWHVTRTSGPASARAAVAPERDDELGANGTDLALEPLPACLHLGRRGLLVDSSLAARRPLEVLHRVRDVQGLTRQSHLLEGVVENPTRRPDERLAGPVLLVAGLLADEHDACGSGPLTANTLRGPLPEAAGPASIELPDRRKAECGMARRGRPLWFAHLGPPSTPDAATRRRTGEPPDGRFAPDLTGRLCVCWRPPLPSLPPRLGAGGLT